MVVTFCGHVTNSFWMGIKMNIKKKKKHVLYWSIIRKSRHTWFPIPITSWS